MTQTPSQRRYRDFQRVVASNLKRLIKRHHWTVRGLSGESGLSTEVITRLCSMQPKRRGFDITTLWKLAEALSTNDAQYGPHHLTTPWQQQGGFIVEVGGGDLDTVTEAKVLHFDD